MALYLSEALKERVLTFPETSYGANTVAVTLSTGAVFSGVKVAWGYEVVRVDGYAEIPFAGPDVVAVEDASGLI